MKTIENRIRESYGIGDKHFYSLTHDDMVDLLSWIDEYFNIKEELREANREITLLLRDIQKLKENEK